MGALTDTLCAARIVDLDSVLFISYFEEHPRYQALCTMRSALSPQLRANTLWLDTVATCKEHLRS